MKFIILFTVLIMIIAQVAVNPANGGKLFLYFICSILIYFF